MPRRTETVDAPAEWRSPLLGISAAVLLFETLTGLAVFLLPFSEFNQFAVVLHTAFGILMALPVTWYLVRHWWVRRKGNLSHYQLLGYFAVALLAVCAASGFVVTWQGLASTRMETLWDQVHLLTGIGFALFAGAHLATVIVRKIGASQVDVLRRARRTFWLRTGAGCALLLGLCGVWAAIHVEPQLVREFPGDYNWRFGEDRPFAPSQARIDTAQWASGLKGGGALDPRALAGSKNCGKSGCHSEIYAEWLPSAHRYSSLDDMFQHVQTLMAAETSPEHTRYCAGCHDPISLFSGAKNSGNITLSAEGASEGSSCLFCHSVVQTDIQGNGDYTVRPARRYVYETEGGWLASVLSDFLIRTYPEHHVAAYSRALYKTPEFCAACHKQYIDKEVNTDIGKVQGQNQYDSWKNSRWNHGKNPQTTIECRECHMPLVPNSSDPARGDVTDYNRTVVDGKHRSHRMLASNLYIPARQHLEGAEKHVELTKKWLRGEIEIPEIAEKWTSGPVIRMEILAPEQAAPGEPLRLQVVLTNNKTGHDFPTGPLDMIESWVELTVRDPEGKVIYHSGGLDGEGKVDQSQIIFKANGFDRQGEPIDRHNLWDLVGASYKRSLYPGVTDTVHVKLQCPSMARKRVAPQAGDSPPGERRDRFSFSAPATDKGGELVVTADLWYRKANPEFLDRVYGKDSGLRSPVTRISSSTKRIKIVQLAGGQRASSD